MIVINEQVADEIRGKLYKIEVDNNVRIMTAIESGSRAWGFPSPDSDYDCRFMYVRMAYDYLTLWPARDVIEPPPDVYHAAEALLAEKAAGREMGCAPLDPVLAAFIEGEFAAARAVKYADDAAAAAAQRRELADDFFRSVVE